MYVTVDNKLTQDNSVYDKTLGTTVAGIQTALYKVHSRQFMMYTQCALTEGLRKLKLQCIIQLTQYTAV